MLTPQSGARAARWGWAAVAVNLAVIVWGAFVRASGSGAGCGNHWPLCNGAVVPKAPAVATLIELTHRLTSGVALLVVLGLVWVARREFAPHHRVRRAAWTAMVLIIVEALIGAGLVKWELVTDNQSMERAVTLAAHLVNTQFLLAALALAAWWAGGGPAPTGRRNVALWSIPITLVLLAVGVTGAVASLGNTLFPAESLGAGLALDRDPTAHFLIRLRVLHPMFAIVGGAAAMGYAGFLAVRHRHHAAASQHPTRVIVMVLAQWALGAVTLLTLAPVPMQLLHLLNGDLLWICWVMLVAWTLADQDAGAGRTNVATAWAASASNTDPAPSSR